MILSLIKGFFYICLILLGLLIAGIVFMIFFVNPNQYKPEIINSLQKSTGRSVVIQGNIQWTFFPALGIKVDGLTLGNPAGFPEANFFSVKEADMSVALWPLFKSQIQIGKIVLDHLELNLIKNTKGEVNWRNSGLAPKGKFLDPVDKPRDDNNRFFKLALFSIGEIDLKNSRIVYQDQKQNKEIILDQLQLESKNIAFNKLFPIEIKTKFLFKDNKISQPVDIKLSANMLVNTNKLRLQDLDGYTNQYHWTGWLEINPFKKAIAGLNGNIKFSGKSGAFQGIDLYYYSDLADAMVKQTKPLRQDTHQTPFNNIQGILEIQNGVVTNQDLFIQAQGMNASGQGAVNLVNQQLDYQISLQRLTSGNEIKPRGPAIPLLVTGTFSDPKIRPDWTRLAVTQIKSQIQDQIEKHKDQIPESIQKGLQSLLGNG